MAKLDIQEVLTRVTNLKKDCNRKANTVRDQQKKLDQLEKLVNSLQERHAGLQTEVTDIRSRVEQSAESMSTLNSALQPEPALTGKSRRKEKQTAKKSSRQARQKNRLLKYPSSGVPGTLTPLMGVTARARRSSRLTMIPRYWTSFGIS